MPAHICSNVIRLVSLVSLALYNINCSDTYNQVHIFLFYRNPRKFLFPARHNTFSKLNASILVFGTGGKSIMIGQGITKRMLKQKKSSLPPIEKIPDLCTTVLLYDHSHWQSSWHTQHYFPVSMAHLPNETQPPPPPPPFDQSQITVTMLPQCMLNIQSEGLGLGKSLICSCSILIALNVALNCNEIHQSFDHVPRGKFE